MSTTRCPRCMYSLYGLPGPVVCPECGLELGTDPVVFRTRGLSWLILACSSLAVGISFALVTVCGGAKPTEAAWLAPFGIIACGSAARWYFGYPRVVVVSQDAVTMFSKRRDTVRVSFSNIVGAEVSPVDGALQIVGSGGRSLRRFYLGSVRLSHAAANEIRYRAHPSEETLSPGSACSS